VRRRRRTSGRRRQDPAHCTRLLAFLITRDICHRLASRRRDEERHGRETALSPTPTDRSAPNQSAGIGRGAATTRSPARRSTGSGNDSASSGWSFAPQTRTGWAHGPGQDGTIDPRQAVVPGGEEENKGIRAAAGGPLLALNPVQVQARIRGEVKDAPRERRAADRTVRLVPGNSSRGSCSLAPPCSR
jgi:hypothetical protein